MDIDRRLGGGVTWGADEDEEDEDVDPVSLEEPSASCFGVDLGLLLTAEGGWEAPAPVERVPRGRAVRREAIGEGENRVGRR